MSQTCMMHANKKVYMQCIEDRTLICQGKKGIENWRMVHLDDSWEATLNMDSWFFKMEMTTGLICMPSVAFGTHLSMRLNALLRSMLEHFFLMRVYQPSSFMSALRRLTMTGCRVQLGQEKKGRRGPEWATRATLGRSGRPSDLRRANALQRLTVSSA